jgi:hypothetical protein
MFIKKELIGTWRNCRYFWWQLSLARWGQNIAVGSEIFWGLCWLRGFFCEPAWWPAFVRRLCQHIQWSSVLSSIQLDCRYVISICSLRSPYPLYASQQKQRKQRVFFSLQINHFGMSCALSWYFYQWIMCLDTFSMRWCKKQDLFVLWKALNPASSLASFEHSLPRVYLQQLLLMLGKHS